MKIWQLSKITSEEKEDILSKHRTLYDGWKTLQERNSEPQPLYVQDFAKDKAGAVLNNKGNVKAYTNVNINESLDENVETCNECGGEMFEGECLECGGSYMNEKEECMECGDQYESECLDCDKPKVSNIHNIKDLGGSKFDYVKEYDIMESAWSDVDEEETIYELELEEDFDESEMKENWALAVPFAAGAVNSFVDRMEEEEVDENMLTNFAAGQAGSYVGNKVADAFGLDEELGEEEWNKTELPDWEEISEELSEDFKVEKNRILEMFNRINVIK